jgi:hypothetical protein
MGPRDIGAKAQRRKGAKAKAQRQRRKGAKAALEGLRSKAGKKRKRKVRGGQKTWEEKQRTGSAPTKRQPKNRERKTP